MVSVPEQRVLEVLAAPLRRSRAIAPLEAVEDDLVSEPRTHRTLRPLRAEHARVARQRLARVRQPIALVGVLDVVVAALDRLVGGWHDLGRRGVGIARDPAA